LNGGGNDIDKIRNISKEVFDIIYENYNQLNAKMAQELGLASFHSGITGNAREEMWMNLFRNIIPRKFSLAQGVMIIDSDRNVSKEVDIAVFDEQYTPYVFQYNTLKFIPIEAVVVAIECKSSELNEEALKKWACSINRLKTKPTGVARMANGYSISLTNSTQKSTRPIKILASKATVDEEDLEEKVINKYGDEFDFILVQVRRSGKEGTTGQGSDPSRTTFELVVKHEDKSLGWWANKLNGTPHEEKTEMEDLKLLNGNNLPALDQYPEIKLNIGLANTLADLKVHGNPLLSLNLQLNQLLMLINNPMLFPHLSYARAFNEMVSSSVKSGG
jgi:hypothetical protein